MRERDLQNLILVELSRAGSTVFRQNVGQAWAGKVAKLDPKTVHITDAYPIHVGLCKGSSDIVGWTPVTITPEMVGQTVALFTGIEVKTPHGRVTDEQRNWLAAVRQQGGIAGVARSVEEALVLIGEKR